MDRPAAGCRGGWGYVCGCAATRPMDRSLGRLPWIALWRGWDRGQAYGKAATGPVTGLPTSLHSGDSRPVDRSRISYRWGWVGMGGVPKKQKMLDSSSLCFPKTPKSLFSYFLVTTHQMATYLLFGERKFLKGSGLSGDRYGKSYRFMFRKPWY